MQTYFPFDSGQGGNITETQWTKMARHWRETGVIKGESYELYVYADSTGRQVKVRPGAAWIKGHYFESDAEETLGIGNADFTNPRIDRVIVRLDWITNTIQLAILQGVPAVSPTAPALTQNSSRWEIGLAQIQVNPAISTIEADKVTDERFTSQFIKPSLLNNWVVNSTDSAYYWRENGMVYFYFEIKSGHPAINTVVAFLPPGYRPHGAPLFRGYAEGGSSTDFLFHVQGSNGEVKFRRGVPGNTLVIMEGCYKAVN